MAAMLHFVLRKMGSEMGFPALASPAVPHLAQAVLFPSPEPSSAHPTLVLGQGTRPRPGGGNFRIWGSISGQNSFPPNPAA